MMRGRNLIHWLGYLAGVTRPKTQTTIAERELLARCGHGKRSLIEIGVMHGVTTRLLRGAMAEDGCLTAIDPHPAGALGMSIERLIARREIGRVRRGRAVLLRAFSRDAAADWTTPIDFLFIDGDHSWAGIDRDWRDWSRHLVLGGIVALHDSRALPGRPDLDSVRYTQDVILADPRFRQVDAVDSLTVLERIA